jgi:N-acetylmuramoyl-L-alanine amidase
MPSVLVETGFITCPSEEKYLNSKEGQDYLASSIYRACREYLNAIDSRSGISWVKNQDQQVKADTSDNIVSSEDDISFMIQVTTSINKIEIKPENFKGLKDIVEINAGDRFKYATGSFTDYTAAVAYRKKIEGSYPDAFVIAVKDNKILPLQQALEQKRKTKKDY